MKVLVFGATGMIGYAMLRRLSSVPGLKLMASLRSAKQRVLDYPEPAVAALYRQVEIHDHLAVENSDAVLQLLDQLKPDVILNCVGITLRRPEVSDYEFCKKINADFPHLLARWVQQNQSYLIHFSTDCVFSGKDPQPYTEDSEPTAQDHYGKTKALGEVSGENCLTLRGSMIGPEIFYKSELLEWALSQKNSSVKGFAQVIYSGVTTQVMAALVAKILALPNRPSGLYQVSSQPISKYELLVLLNEKLSLNLQISREESPKSSKILSSDKIRKQLGFICPSWSEMLDEMANSLFNKS